MSGMIQTHSDEEWNAVCRHMPNVKMCEQYYTIFHQTRALILKLSELCKQLNASIHASLKKGMQYAFSMDEFARVQEQKIDAMTLSEFEKKINQKINACLNRFSIRKCELPKIQIYIDSINKLNVKVRSQWDAFMKNITPVKVTDTIKDILKMKFDSKRLNNIIVKKESDSEWYHVTGDMIPPLKVNPRTGDVIEVSNIQAAGKHKSHFKKTRNNVNKHNKRHSRRHSRRHSIRHSRRHSRRHLRSVYFSQN